MVFQSLLLYCLPQSQIPRNQSGVADQPHLLRSSPLPLQAITTPTSKELEVVSMPLQCPAGHGGREDLFMEYNLHAQLGLGGEVRGGG